MYSKEVGSLMYLSLIQITPDRLSSIGLIDLCQKSQLKMIMKGKTETAASKDKIDCTEASEVSINNFPEGRFPSLLIKPEERISFITSILFPPRGSSTSLEMSVSDDKKLKISVA